MCTFMSTTMAFAGAAGNFEFHFKNLDAKLKNEFGPLKCTFQFLHIRCFDKTKNYVNLRGLIK